jgi:hypothetical protein
MDSDPTGNHVPSRWPSGDIFAGSETVAHPQHPLGSFEPSRPVTGMLKCAMSSACSRHVRKHRVPAMEARHCGFETPQRRVVRALFTRSIRAVRPPDDNETRGANGAAITIQSWRASW